MWLFVNIIFMVQFTIAGTITFSEKPIDTIGILGDEVQLNCSFNDWTSEGLIWNKERPEEYAISLNEEVYQDGHYLVDEFGTGAYSLRIVNTTERHEGEYKCEAFGATLRSFAELYLMDELPTCDVYPGVTVKAGEDTTFNCSVYKAVPPGELRWRMDGNVVSTGGNSSTYSWVTSFDRTQNNAVMVCGLEYITLSEPLACEDTIVMDVQYTPEMGVVVTGDGSPTGQVIEGDSFLADCAVVDSNPEAENIRWFDADGDVVGTGERLEFNTVHRNQTDDAYTCMSSVSFYDGSQGNGSTVFTINVQYLSNVDVQYDDNGIAVEGDAFQATCTADANPDPEFTWIGPGESEVGRGYSLTLQDVEPGDSGMYSCYAKVTYWNGSSRTENASFELDVQFSPRMDRNVTGDASHGGKVIEGDSFAVECLVLDANPDHNDDIQWFDDEMNTVGDDEWLIFDEVDKSEAGNYTCTATNTFFNGGVGEGETAITIDVQYLYDVVIHEDSGGKVIKGDTYTAHCSAEANPTADIAWVDADGETVVDGSTLVFDDAQLSDAGLYVCRGDVVFWDLTPKSSSDSVLLDVQYISDVVIHDESDGKVIEGHSYYANCTADANPAAVVSWTTPGGDVTFGEELAKEGAERADSGNYTCTANVTYWDGTVEVTQSGFYLDIQYQPEVTIFDQSDGKSIEGDRYDAVCQVESNPDSDVAWVGPDDNVVASSPHLTFDAVGVENSGTYTCQANNTFWDGSTASGDAIIFIDVQYISDAVVFSENDGMVIEGSAFYANCSVEANPVAEMSWLTPFQNTIVGDILHIDKTSRTDSGNYTCVGSVTFWNGTVEESRSTILLDVQYSPNVDIEQASGGKVLEGERFNAECTAEANPDPDTVWQDPSGVTLSVGTTLVIDNTRLEDGGVYTCLANNTFWDGSVGSGNSTIFVDVQYMSDAVINYESGGRVIEGQTYYANCSADANPAAEISWRKPDGETLRSEYVEIDEADKTDGGNYTCIATTAFWDGTEGQSESSFYLDVQYISDVHIYEENEGKVIEGQGFYANCSSDANPAAVIAWRTPTGGSIDGVELVIEQAERTDDGSYVCTASTTYWDGSSDQSESDVFVDVQYLHEISIFNENDGKVIEGQTYYANCSADSNPTADISWLAPDGGQTPGEELQLEQASRTVSGEYRCTATVTYWDETEVSDEKSVTVDVQYLSTIDMVVSPSTQVNEGQDVSIRCRATDGNPDPYLMSLIRDPDEILAEEEASELQYDIRAIDRSKSGTYRCRASTRFYDGSEDISEDEQNIVVQYAPTIAEEDPTKFEAELKDRVTLNCTADGVPTPTVTWYDPGNKAIPGNEDNRKITTVEEGSIVTSSLAVTVVDDSFYGNYSCVASNVIGESNRHERIIEAPPSTAEPLSGVNIAVLVSVIVLIIVIFVVFAVVSYYRKEKKKAKYEASKKEQSTQGRLELDKIEIDGNANEGMSVVPDEADGLATFTGEAKNNEDMNGLGDINNETDVTFAGQESTPNGETDHSTVDIDVNGQL